jgi:hypothetical protein
MAEGWSCQRRAKETALVTEELKRPRAAVAPAQDALLPAALDPGLAGRAMN